MVAFAYASLAFAAVSAVSGTYLPSDRLMKHAVIARKAKPPTYNEPYLEPYQTYHTRYLALDCEDKHNTTFFKECCHPLLSTETLQTARPKQCRPSAAALSSAALAEPTSTVGTPADNGGKPKASGDLGGASQDPPKQDPPKQDPPKQDPPKQAPPKQDPPQQNPPKPASSSSGGGGSDDITGGVATFFFQKGNAGACGTVHQDSDLICAMDSQRFQGGGLCGKQVHITNTKNGKSVTVTVADECPTCNNGNSIDLSTGAFTQIATEAEGEVPISWHFA